MDQEIKMMMTEDILIGSLKVGTPQAVPLSNPSNSSNRTHPGQQAYLQHSSRSSSNSNSRLLSSNNGVLLPNSNGNMLPLLRSNMFRLLSSNGASNNGLPLPNNGLPFPNNGPLLPNNGAPLLNNSGQVAF